MWAGQRRIFLGRLMSKGRAAQRVGTKRGCASPSQLTPTAVLPGGLVSTSLCWPLQFWARGSGLRNSSHLIPRDHKVHTLG